MDKNGLANARGNAAGSPLVGLSRDELLWLVAPNEHIMLLDSRRAAMILSRVRLVAALFAMLTPLWGVLDYLTFPPELFRDLLLGRAAATLAFAAILVFFRGRRQMTDARVALLLLFAIPTLFFLHSAILLEPYHLDGFPQAVAATHAFLPFVVATGMSIFPITAVEGLLLAAPVLAAKAGAGVLSGATTDWPQVFGATWLLLLVTGVALLASMSQLAFIIALVRHAIRDPLTGVFSRQSGVEMLDIQFTVSERAGTPLTVAFVDIDWFKRVNDEYGHEVGDMVLLNAATRIASQLRTGDILVRWGGEEFVIVLPNTDAAQAQAGLERLREGGLGMRPELTPVTASMGVAERIADGVENWPGLVALADARMYEAKRAGRNRIVTGGSPPAGASRPLQG